MSLLGIGLDFYHTITVLLISEEKTRISMLSCWRVRQRLTFTLVLGVILTSNNNKKENICGLHCVFPGIVH